MSDSSSDLRAKRSRFVAGLRALWGDDGRGWILVWVALGWLLGLGIRLVFPAVLPNIRAEFAMDNATAGLLLSALWIGYALMQFPGGALADRFGERAVLVVSCAVVTVGVVGVVVAPAIIAFFVATILVGIGAGLYGTTRITVLADVFPDRSGTAIGINQAAGNVGTTILPAMAGFLAVAIGWRWGFGVVLPLFVLVMVGLWMTVPTRTSTDGGLDHDFSRAHLGYLLRCLRHPQVVFVNVTMALVSFVYQAFTGFYPTYLVDVKGLGTGTAATLLGVFFATAVVIQPLAGAARDRFGARITLAAVVVGSAAVIAILPFVQGFWILVVVTVLASVQLAVWPISNSYVVDAVPDDVQGTTVGITRTGYLLFGAIGPVIIGIAADAGRFDHGLFLLAAIALLAALPALALSAPSPPAIEE